jgi:hypothetical protein
MSLQNRVDPYGRLHAVNSRGAWMGNRGVLHNEAKKVVAPWRGKRWITCVLEFRGRKREVFTPGRYSELFFMDEASAYAAGHRPCAECRREDFNRFRAAWTGPKASVDDIDAVLHAERAVKGGGKRTYDASVADLPDGTFVDLGGTPSLVHSGRLLPWTFEGYGRPGVRFAFSRRSRS